QRRPRAGPGLHRRLVHGGGAGRGRTARRHRHRGDRARTGEQAPRAVRGSGARQDRRAGGHHPLHPAATAGPVRAARARRGGRVKSGVLASFERLYPRRALLGIGSIYAFLVVVVPVLNLAVPAGSALHVSDYTVALAGKILCYAMVALAMDLIWGYTGILSLGHGLFFALGGYAMGMYLMRSIGTEGVYGSTLPDFMVFLDWKELPWYWRGSDRFLQALLLVVLAPGLVALVFGFFAFRSRIRGVYFSIITQALTFAALLRFCLSETGFGGHNGFTDFKRILGFPLADPRTKMVLFVLTATALLGELVLCRFIVRSKLGRVLTAIRHVERRVRFCGYETTKFTLLVFSLSALLGGIAGAVCVPQLGL